MFEDISLQIIVTVTNRSTSDPNQYIKMLTKHGYLSQLTIFWSRIKYDCYVLLFLV